MGRHTVHPRRWQILAALCLSLLLIGLDHLILNMALPMIQKDFGSTGTQMQWTVDSYTLAFGGLLLLCGSLADRFGRRLLLVLGMLVFLVFSVAAAFSTDSTALIVMRTAMGTGAAMIMPATLAIIKDVFPAEEQAKAIGIWAGSAALGVPLGPVIGGLLLDNFWWGSVFLVNAPVVVAALIAATFLIPESRNRNHPGLDLQGALLSAVGLGVLVYGLVEASRNGWTDRITLASLGVGALLMAGFVLRERSTQHPMLSPVLFGDARFTGSALAVAAVSFGMFGSLFVLTQYLQFVLGYEPLTAGVRLLAAASMIIVAPISPKLVERLGLRTVLTSGLVLLTVALTLTAGADAGSDTRVVWSLALFGIGMGLTMPASADAMLAAAPSGQAGAGASVTDAAMQVGGALGIAVIGSALANSYRDALPELGHLPPETAAAVGDSVGAAGSVATKLGGEPGRRLLDAANDAFMTGLANSMLIAAGVSALGAVAAFLVLPRRTQKARHAAGGTAVTGPADDQHPVGVAHRH